MGPAGGHPVPEPRRGGGSRHRGRVRRQGRQRGARAGVHGVDELATRDAKVHLNALATGDYDIGFITAIPDVADAAQLLGDYVGDAPENYPQWRHDGFDAAFNRALTLADPAARAAALREAEDLLLSQAPVAPIYFNAKIWLMSPRVRGWQEDGLWSRCYDQMRLAAP